MVIGQIRLPTAQSAAAVAAGWTVVAVVTLGYGTLAVTNIIVEHDSFPPTNPVDTLSTPAFATVADAQAWLASIS